MEFVQPKTYLVGITGIHSAGLLSFLHDTANDDFLEDMAVAQMEGRTPAEILCSVMAKLCYQSLTPGKNPNVEETRGITGNLKGCYRQRHGSVFEHASFNFITVNCSRIFTHELVRHRVGVAFSQESGRYCRPVENQIRLVDVPDLDPAKGPHASALRSYFAEAVESVEEIYAEMVRMMEEQLKTKEAKKELTSLLRRILPNGMANMIGWTSNVRQLRHMLVMRTSPGAEVEIRQVFNQVYDLVMGTSPLALFGIKPGEPDDRNLRSFTECLDD